MIAVVGRGLAGRGLVWMVAALAAISLGAAAGPVVWRLAGDDGRSVAALPVAVAVDAGPALDLGPVFAFAPFGSAAVPETVAPVIAGETALGLTLLGVTIATPPGASRAIIAGGTAPGQSYAVGDAISAAAALAEVHAGHVVLRLADRLETLSFPGRGGAVVAPIAGPDLRNLIPVNTVAAVPAAATGDTPDAVIARYRAAIALNPQQVMDRLGLEATKDGYRITEAASPGVRQAGFRPGDTVTSVNGVRVGDTAQDRQTFDVVAASGRARVELLRDGQTIVMSFPLR